MNVPLPQPTWPWAVVEITADAVGEDRSGLLLSAYRASRAGVVGLALRGVTPASVDHVLDGVVDSRDTAVKGVVFLDAAEEATLLAAASHAKLVVAATPRLRERLRAHGIRAVEPHDAEFYLSEAGSARRAPALPAA